MIGVKRLLFATTCVALFATALGQHCNRASWGSPFGAKFVLDTVTLAPDIVDWTIAIQKPEYCGLVYGVFVTKACDYDVMSSVRLKRKFIVAIHRHGKTEQPGSVDITVYCALHRKIL